MSTPVNYGNILTEIQMGKDEIEYIQNCIKNMPEDGLMVEWGSGGSTCGWIEALSGNQKLISVEHTEAWYNRVNRAINAHFGDVSDKFKFYHIPEKFIEHGYASVIEEHPCGTDNYLLPPDERWWDADIFFIDGIARATCALVTLLKHKKENPVIFIHDYIGREPWYSWASQFYDVEYIGTAENKSTLVRLHIKK